MIYIKVKQNDNWKNLIGPDYSIFKGYTILTPDMVSGTIGSSQNYIGTATHLIIDDSFPTDNLQELFSREAKLESLVILTDKFTDMNNMFYYIDTQLKSLFINTSNVTDMNYMFYRCYAPSLDLSSFDTSNVTNMSSMFSECKSASIDLSSFNTSNVTDMSSMFEASQATTLDISSFDTSNVTNMSYMFMNAKITSLDLSSWDTSNVTDMSYMFAWCQATVGYARTQADADKFNATDYKPDALNFIVKP